MTQRYSSFSEIDKHLKVLRLKREIHKESLKLDLNRVKTDLNPVQMFAKASIGWKQELINFAINKGLQGLHKLRRKELTE